MEEVFEPGMRSMVHRHHGVEAWYTLEGVMCLESPGGIVAQRPGEPGVMVPGGVPMMLKGMGTTTRRSLALILQDATQPGCVPAPGWVPPGRCGG